MEGENVEDKVDNEAEDEVDDEEDDDDVSIYPDTQEFYAWLSMDGPSGAFLACHGLETMEAAIAAIKEVKEDEKEKEKVKEIVDDAIDNAYCITVVDAAAPAVEGEGEEKKKEEEGEKKDTPAAAPTTSALWSLAETAGKDKLWMKIKVAREKPAADEKMEAVDIAVADLDPREGLIIPKISGWKYLVGVESVSKEVSDAIKGMMEANL
ncbi:hypothetical protein BC829DRAFT_420011 [Chytridium lagenaria]|nr:hypothetical protein BC829DRAFT_420011 [Chytridium lagenaria]